MVTLKMGEYDLVQSSFLFAGAPDALKSALADAGCTLVEYARGQTVYAPESFLKSLGLVLEGSLQVWGANLSLRTIEKGEAFGAAALWNEEENYVSRLTVKSRCRILFLSQILLRRLIRENFVVAENYIAFLSDKIKYLNEKIHALSCQGAQGKLLHYLSGAADADGVVPAAVSLSELARRLNMGRASLYRALDQLEQEGRIVRGKGREIRLL